MQKSNEKKGSRTSKSAADKSPSSSPPPPPKKLTARQIAKMERLKREADAREAARLQEEAEDEAFAIAMAQERAALGEQEQGPADDDEMLPETAATTAVAEVIEPAAEVVVVIVPMDDDTSAFPVGEQALSPKERPKKRTKQPIVYVEDSEEDDFGELHLPSFGKKLTARQLAKREREKREAAERRAALAAENEFEEEEEEGGKGVDLAGGGEGIIEPTLLSFPHGTGEGEIDFVPWEGPAPDVGAPSALVPDLTVLMPIAPLDSSIPNIPNIPTAAAAAGSVPMIPAEIPVLQQSPGAFLEEQEHVPVHPIVEECLKDAGFRETTLAPAAVAILEEVKPAQAEAVSEKVETDAVPVQEEPPAAYVFTSSDLPLGELGEPIESPTLDVQEIMEMAKKIANSGTGYDDAGNHMSNPDDVDAGDANEAAPGAAGASKSGGKGGSSTEKKTSTQNTSGGDDGGAGGSKRSRSGATAGSGGSGPPGGGGGGSDDNDDDDDDRRDKRPRKDKGEGHGADAGGGPTL